MNEKTSEVRKAMEWLTRYLHESSTRERILIGCVIAGVAMFGVYYLTQSVQSAFAVQAYEMTRAEQDAAQLEESLVRFRRLKARRDAIEAYYKKVEIKEGAGSFLENLINTKKINEHGMGPKPITQGPRKPFGKSYEQQSFTIKLQTANLEGLVEFLKVVLEGEKPLVLAGLKLSKNPGLNYTHVEMSIGTIHRVKE